MIPFHLHHARLDGAHTRRASVLMLVATLALLLAGVAVAQSSANFDLACRGTLDVAGTLRTSDSGSFSVIDAVGQPGAGISSSANFGVNAGYVQPYSIQGQANQSAAPAAVEQNNRLNMPYIARIVQVIRACSW
jgi:hypothetical protein